MCRLYWFYLLLLSLVAQELVKENKEKIKKIEEEFEIKVEELEEEKKQELEKTVEELADKPDELAKSIANLLGSNLVEK